MIGQASTATNVAALEVAGGTSVDRYSFAATRIRMPDGGLTTTTSPNVWKLVQFRCCSPDYVTTAPRFCWVLAQSNAANSSPTEIAISGGTLTMQAVCVSLNNGASWVDCDGAADAGIVTLSAADLFWWSPPCTGLSIPANTSMLVRLVYFTDVGTTIPRQVAGTTNENGFGTNVDYWANRQSSGLTPAGNGGGAFWLPTFCVAKGGDGRPAGLIMGASGDAHGENDGINSVLWTSRLVIGSIEKGLDDNTTLVNGVPTKRIAYGTVAAAGQYAAYDASVAPLGWGSTTNWSRKLAALQYINSTYGAWPFDFVLGAPWGNSINSFATYALNLAAMESYFTLIKSTFGKPIIMNEGQNFFVSSTDLYATTANQTATGSSIYPTGRVWLFRTDTSGDPTQATVDFNSTLIAGGYIIDSVKMWKGGSADPTNAGGIINKLAVQSFSTTLAAAYVSGSTCSLTDSPPLGAALLWTTTSLGTAGIVVDSVTGTGPYTVTFSPFSTPTATAIGATVQQVIHDNTGLHPAPLSHQNFYAPEFVKWKARALPIIGGPFV